MSLVDMKTTAQDSMEKAVTALINELKKVRTGRAQVSMLDNIKVDYYGTMTPLNQVSAISTPDARSFLIAPWEAPMVKAIEQAIVKSDLGMAPMSDGKVVRLKVPDLTEQRRKDMVKAMKKTVEDAKVAVRMARRDANEAAKTGLKNKDFSEDENKRAQEEIQKMTDQYIEKIDKLAGDKEKEIMTI